MIRDRFVMCRNPVSIDAVVIQDALFVGEALRAVSAVSIANVPEGVEYDGGGPRLSILYGLKPPYPYQYEGFTKGSQATHLQNLEQQGVTLPPLWAVFQGFHVVDPYFIRPGTLSPELTQHATRDDHAAATSSGIYIREGKVIVLHGITAGDGQKIDGVPGITLDTKYGLAIPVEDFPEINEAVLFGKIATSPFAQALTLCSKPVSLLNRQHQKKCGIDISDLSPGYHPIAFGVAGGYQNLSIDVKGELYGPMALRAQYEEKVQE